MPHPPIRGTRNATDKWGDTRKQEEKRTLGNGSAVERHGRNQQGWWSAPVQAPSHACSRARPLRASASTRNVDQDAGGVPSALLKKLVPHPPIRGTGNATDKWGDTRKHEEKRTLGNTRKHEESELRANGSDK